MRGFGLDFLSLLVHVNDMIITGANPSATTKLKLLLNKNFNLKNLGDLKYFLGLELARSSTGIYLSQRHYTLQLLEDVGLLGSKPEAVPMNPHLKLR